MGRDQERDTEGSSQRRDLFLIDLPRSPRPLSHVIIGRIFDLHSLWKGCVISSAHSCVRLAAAAHMKYISFPQLVNSTHYDSQI